MPDYLRQRLNMVESQVRTSDVTDERIQAAMREIPRDRFVPEDKRPLAYADTAVEVWHRRYLLDPRTFAKLAQLAEIAPTDRLLDVGCASGYSTAVLARLAGAVTAIEDNDELVARASQLLAECGCPARVLRGKLSDGAAAHAPYDVIFINGAIEVEPLQLFEQLGESGRLVTIIRAGKQSRANLFVRDRGRVGNRTDFDAYVPVLPGFAREKAFVF